LHYIRVNVAVCDAYVKIINLHIKPDDNAIAEIVMSFLCLT